MKKESLAWVKKYKSWNAQDRKSHFQRRNTFFSPRVSIEIFEAYSCRIHSISTSLSNCQATSKVGVFVYFTSTGTTGTIQKWCILYKCLLTPSLCFNMTFLHAIFLKSKELKKEIRGLVLPWQFY